MGDKMVKELKRKISELKSQWPKHSVSTAMIRQLDELEEELERELEKVSKSKTDAVEDTPN
jgi:SMC interacting uncharacterized protein involved in chromosome segregation